MGNAWLEKHSSDFSLMNWQYRILSLNPVEHIMDALENIVNVLYTTPASFTKLCTYLADVYGKQCLCGHNSASFLNLCFVVLQPLSSRGSLIPYKHATSHSMALQCILTKFFNDALFYSFSR